MKFINELVACARITKCKESFYGNARNAGVAATDKFALESVGGGDMQPISVANVARFLVLHGKKRPCPHMICSRC